MSYENIKHQDGSRQWDQDFLTKNQIKNFKAAWNTGRWANDQNYDSFIKDYNEIDLEAFSLLKNISESLKPYNGVIAGSSVAFASINEFDKAKDIDVFFYGDNEYYFDKLIKEVSEGILIKDNMWTYNEVQKESYMKSPKKTRFVELIPAWDNTCQKKIQLNKLLQYECPKHIIKSFDLTCVKFSIHTNKLNKTLITYDHMAMKDLKDKRLVVTGTYHVGSLLSRIVKYHKRGFTWEGDYSLEDLKRYIDEEHLIKKADNHLQNALEEGYKESGGMGALHNSKDEEARYHGFTNWADMQKAIGA